MLIEILKRKLSSYGKELIEIDTTKAKASQFNQFTGEYIKKDLKTRWNIFHSNDVNKTLGINSFDEDLYIQRDLYSAFLIMNTNPKTKDSFDLGALNAHFLHFLEMHNSLIISLKDKNNPYSFGI